MRPASLTRRSFLKQAVAGGIGLAAGGALSGCGHARRLRYPDGFRAPLSLAVSTADPAPNVVLINADDLGYGDLGCYGGKAIRTPHIDRLAEQGVRFTDFYACDSVCTPSRAGMLTGRYPKRMGLDVPLHPDHLPLKKRLMLNIGYLAGRLGIMDIATEHGAAGLPTEEITIAEALHLRGYCNGMVGKWHLGDFSADDRHHPLNHGFDRYFGVPYSNDMTPFPLFKDRQMLERNVTDQGKLTGLYTREALDFIHTSRDRPFFLYMAHTFPHRPLHASAAFINRSEGGRFGDAVEELDWSVGRILSALDDHHLADRTLVIFTSDNGPWYQGSPGGFRGRKGQSYEGGHRVPFIARWPGRIPPRRICRQPAMNIDLFPSLMHLAGVALPSDRIIDGKDITGLLTGDQRQSPHEALYFYHHGMLEGVRSGHWKYIRSINHYVWPLPVNKKLGRLSNYTTGPLPMLFDLRNDPGEAYDLAATRPDVARRLDGLMTRWESDLAANPAGSRL